jgi:DNA-binding NarL/FixJ family response regulator
MAVRASASLGDLAFEPSSRCGGDCQGPPLIPLFGWTKVPRQLKGGSRPGQWRQRVCSGGGDIALLPPSRCRPTCPYAPRVAIRVVFADDSYLIREAVTRLLDSHEDIDVVAICGDLDSLLQTVETEQPDVVLTDIRMPPDGTNEGIRAAEYLREKRPDTGVVVLSNYTDPEYAIDLFQKGSARRAYLLKERVEDLEQLAEAICKVAAGGSVIDPQVVDALVAAKARAERSSLSELTPRETEVLGEMAQGKNNAAIAASLVLTERAVEKHIHSIFSKLNLSYEKDVHKRVMAVLLYFRMDG